jgi:hypothetical protein
MQMQVRTLKGIPDASGETRRTFTSKGEPRPRYPASLACVRALLDRSGFAVFCLIAYDAWSGADGLVVLTQAGASS